MILKAVTIPPIKFPRPRGAPARAGLRYEKSVVKNLHATAPTGIEIQSGVWFEYVKQGSRYPLPCCPDALIFDMEEGFIIVVEVKVTWTPLALPKLKELYCPVVMATFDLPAKPLVICKHLIPGAPRPQPTLGFAFQADSPLYQWLGLGPIQW